LSSSNASLVSTAANLCDANFASSAAFLEATDFFFALAPACLVVLFFLTTDFLLSLTDLM
jgi:hypothetical protein